jgi:hypothetical protein
LTVERGINTAAGILKRCTDRRIRRLVESISPPPMYVCRIATYLSCLPIATTCSLNTSDLTPLSFPYRLYSRIRGCLRNQRKEKTSTVHQEKEMRPTSRSVTLQTEIKSPRATSKRETWRKDNETTKSNLVPLHEERST